MPKTWAADLCPLGPQIWAASWLGSKLEFWGLIKLDIDVGKSINAMRARRLNVDFVKAVQVQLTEPAKRWVQNPDWDNDAKTHQGIRNTELKLIESMDKQYGRGVALGCDYPEPTKYGEKR